MGLGAQEAEANSQVAELATTRELQRQAMREGCRWGAVQGLFRV